MAAMVSFHPLDTTRFGSSTLRRLPKSISNRYKLCLGGGNVGFRLGSIPEIRLVKLGLVTDFRLGSIPEICLEHAMPPNNNRSGLGVGDFDPG